MKKFLINLNVFALITVLLLSGSAGSFFAYGIVQSKEEVASEILVKDTTAPRDTTKPTDKPAPTDTQPTDKPQPNVTSSPKPSQTQPTTKPNNNPTNTSQTDYYSPSLDLTFSYSKDELRLSESTRSVAIYLAGSSTVAVSYGKVEKSTATSVKEVEEAYTKKYTSLYPSAKVSGVKAGSDDIEMTVSYDYKSFLDNSTTTRHQYIYGKKIDGGFLVLDYTYSDGFDIDSYKQIFKDLITSANTQSSSTSGSSSLSSTIKDGNMTVDFDKKKWNISTQSDSYLSLFFRSSEYETDPSLKYSSTSISFRATVTSSPVDEAYLLKRLDYDVTGYDSYNPTIITRDEKVTIDGLTFYKAQLSYTSGSLSRTRTSYWGYEPTSQAVINISISEQDTTSEGSKEIENVMNSISFSKPTTYAPHKISQTVWDMISIPRKAHAQDLNQQVEIQSSTILGKSAIAHIFNKTCLEIKVKNDKSLTYSGGKTYNVCSAGFGTGFYINADGHLITNAHVANPNPTDAVIASFNDPENEFVEDFARDVEQMLEDSDFEVTSDEEFVYALLGVLLKSIEKDIVTVEATYENYIEGSEPFRIDRETYELENKDKHYTTKTVDSFDLESSYEMAFKKLDKEKVGITVPDLTLLQVTNSNKPVFPALALGDEDLINVGEKIKVIGFPGSANSEEIFGDTASSIASVTEGSVSALKPNFNNQFKMVQIDASVSFGNSGGPIINNKGEVVGVVTYKISGQESADFNAGISVKEVKKFLEKNNVANEVGPTHRLLKRGINNFAKSYFKRSIENLEQVKQAYRPTEEVVNPLIKTAQQQIADGNDKTPQLSFAGYDANLFQMLGLLASAIAFIGSGLLLGLKLAMGKNSDGGNVPPAVVKEEPKVEHKPEPVAKVEEKPVVKEEPAAEKSDASRFAPPKE